MKFFVQIFLLMVVVSCTNNSKELLNDLRGTYNKNMVYTRMETNEKFGDLEYLNAINSIKGEPFYQKGVSVHKMVDSFLIITDSLYLLDKIDASQMLSIEQLSRSITDSIRAIFPQHWDDKLEFVQPDYIKKSYYQTNPKFVLLFMQNDMVKNEAYALEYLRSMISVGCFSFHIIDIDIKMQKTSKNGRDQYLSEEYVQLEGKRIVEVDTIWRNNHIFIFNPKIEPDYSFAKISFDSLPLGNYKVKGHVKLIRDKIHDYTEDFEYHFDVD